MDALPIYSNVKATRPLRSQWRDHRTGEDRGMDIPQGTRGTIVEVYEVLRTPGYEVEFFDSDGDTLDVMTCVPDDVEAA